MSTIKKLFQSNSPGFAYHIVNTLFFATIVMIIVYSFVYSQNNHPIPSVYTDLTGETSPSKGLSAGFSAIVNGDLKSAINHNVYSVRIFSFFLIQLLLRVFFSIITIVWPTRLFKIIIFDAAISVIVFSWCFAPLIVFTLKLMAKLF
jgi:hypothetical protein